MAEAVARPRRSASYRETTFGAESGTQRTQDSEEVGNDKKELLDALTSMKLEITHKERALLDHQRKVLGKKDQAKRDVQDLFDALHELLERKEVEMNNKVDEMYEEIERPISESIEKYNKMKDPVSKLLERHNSGKTISRYVLENLYSVTESGLQSGDSIPMEVNSIPSLVVNSNAKQIIERLDFGTFADHTDSEDIVRNISMEETALDEEESAIENSASSVELVQSADYTDTTVPSAPTLESDTHNIAVGAEGTEEAELPPPPYWEAIGLSGPEDEPNSPTYPSEPSPQYTEYDMVVNIPEEWLSSQYDTGTNLPEQWRSNQYDTGVSENIPEQWHSFPAKRQQDYRKPLYISLSWNLERICVADRNNKKVKFYSCYGDIITEMKISSGEIHDMAFLESCNGEARYILTLPRERLLLLVAIFPDNSTKLVRKIPSTSAGYSSICRGPFEHTLVGAVNPSVISRYDHGLPRVEIFDFEGRIVSTFDRTTYGYFQSPRSITCVGDMIIVADWKLSLVVSFNSLGAEVGIYKGTATSPLINPLDLAVDKYGKVLIVNGEFPNIHVITTECYPVEIIRLPGSGSVGCNIKLVAFDMLTQWLTVVKSSGSIAVFTFKGGYKNLMPNQALADPSSPGLPVPAQQEPERLPFVEGMLPTTIANIGRQRRSNRQPHFFL